MPVITIQNRNNVTVKGLKITGAGTNASGIYLGGSDSCIIENNVLYNNYLGIRVFNSPDNTLSKNTVDLSTAHGILLENTTNNILENNAVNSSQTFGIYLAYSGSNTLRNNAIFNNTNGINLVFSSGNTILNNTVSDDNLISNTHSIFLNNSHNNNLQSNIVSNCEYGIAMRYSNSNNLTANNAYNNSRGIFVAYTSSENTLSGNQANSNLLNGIVLDNCSNNKVTDNTITSNDANGIIIGNAGSNILTNNTVFGNRRGIYITSPSSGNTLSGNRVNSNTNRGIELDNAGTNNNIISNIVDSNGDYGIYLASSSNNYVLNNTASRNSKGIYIMSSSGSTVSRNMLSDNIAEGVMLSLSDSNILSENRASNNSFGISLNSSNSNNISSNTINNCANFSITLCAQSSDNDIFDNYFNSTANARVRNSSNSWNTTKIKVRSIAGGEYRGGNFWGNPDGKSGFSQTAIDADGDGIADNIFTTSNVTDYLPLVAVYIPDPVYPVANFITSVTSGNAPLSVLFTDASQNANEWEWNFGDGNTSSERNLTHVYSSAGKYTVNLTVRNDNGTSSKTAVITVVKADQGENETPIMPVADFSTSSTGGYAPLPVTFTDLSKDATSRHWDVNNDGTIDSTEASFVYEYASAGTYTAKLTAINANGTDSKTADIIVQGNESKIRPVADFSASPTDGYSPLKVTFTDLSKYATSISWDFGDGTGSTEQNPTHTYSGSGKYDAKLTAVNANGTDTKTVQIIVNGRGGGGGGGGGGSPEPARNVEVKELSQVFITNGKPVQFDFTRNATCLVCVSFDAKKTVGKTTTIVEQLKNKSTLVSTLSEGEVYRYFNVWVGNSGFATSTNIENPALCFRVEKSWVQDNKIDRDSIALNRYSNKTWEKQPTSFLREDDKYLYFESSVSGYSFFAITGRSDAFTEETATEIKPEGNSDNFGETEYTESEAGPESEENKEDAGMPGFGMVCGIAGLLAVFLYKRK